LNLRRGKELGSEIRNPEKKSSRIPDPDPWGKKAPDPGSKSATLLKSKKRVNSSVVDPKLFINDPDTDPTFQ
jgi:hypothetical protein